MSLNQIIDKEPLQPLVCDDTLNLKGNQLRLKKEIDVPEGNFTNIDTVTINGSPYPPGGGAVPTLIPNKFLRTTNAVTPTMFWGDVNAAELVHGTAYQILHTDATGSFSEWTTNLRIPGILTVVGASNLSNVDTSGTLNVVGDLQFVGAAGAVGSVLTKTGLATQSFQPLTASSITPGLSNQIFVTNAGGTIAQWASSVTIPSNLIVSNVTDLHGDLQMNGISGGVGSVLTKTGVSLQQWVIPAQIKCCKYVAYFAGQNLNSGVGPTAVTFNTVNIAADYALASRGTFNHITQPTNTQFLIGSDGAYDIQITGFIDPTSTGLVSTVVSLSIEVNGVELATSCVIVNTFSFVGTFSAVFINAGTNVRILARRIANAGTMNTIGFPTAVPNFASTISFTLVNTIN